MINIKCIYEYIHIEVFWVVGLEAVGKTWPAFLRIADVDEDRGEGGREAGSMGRWQAAREGRAAKALNLPSPVTKCRFKDSKACRHVTAAV